jgi:CHASE3 domain sensor protein
MDSKHFFKNDSLIIGQIDANTLKDDNINKLINQQISLYKNVYNDESYNKYIETLTKEINENKALLESELTKYNNTSSEQEQRRIKSNMN